MKGKNLLGKLSLIALFAIASQSCKKENGIDNNNVIKRPYVVYTADAHGNIFKTNDGDNYNTIFPGDGLPLRSFITSKANILFAKDDRLFVSENGGQTFNPIAIDVVVVPKNIRYSNFLLDVPQLNRIYVTNSIAITGKVSFSPENGTYFDSDTSYTDQDTPYVAESFTYLDNGNLFSFSKAGSKFGKSRLFIKTGKDKQWEPKVTDLPGPFDFYLSHKGNTLIATDYDGTQGAYYSDDSGKTFKQFTGLPTTRKLLCTYSANNIVLVGTEKGGLYITSGTAFSSANGGIDANTSVYGIVAKDNLYKNNTTKKFFYLATSTGIYRSEDMAKSWIKVKVGDYRLIN
jgi:hypothetical protein